MCVVVTIYVYMLAGVGEMWVVDPCVYNTMLLPIHKLDASTTLISALDTLNDT